MEQARKFDMRKAKVISNGFNMLSPLIPRTNTLFIYTNHIYTEMADRFGNSGEKSPGGQKSKHLQLMSFKLTKGKVMYAENKLGDRVAVGHILRVDTIKNALHGQRISGALVVLAGIGVSNVHSLFDYGVKLGVIKQAGAWFTCPTLQDPETGAPLKGQGSGAFIRGLMQSPDLTPLEDAVSEALYDAYRADDELSNATYE